MRTLTAHERQRYAIGKARERRAVERAPIRAEVDRLVADVGWRQARPVVAAVMAPVRVTGPRGVWRHRVGKRAGARLVDGLGVLPAQGCLPLDAHPRRSLFGAKGGATVRRDVLTNASIGIGTDGT